MKSPSRFGRQPNVAHMAKPFKKESGSEAIPDGELMLDQIKLRNQAKTAKKPMLQIARDGENASKKEYKMSGIN